MSQQNLELNALKAEAAVSRHRLANHLEAVELSLNIPMRVRKGICSNPIKSAALAAVGGLAAAKVLPLLLRLSSTSFGAQVAKFAVANFGMPLLQSLAQKASLKLNP